MTGGRARAALVAALVVSGIALVAQYRSRTLPDIAFPLWAAGRLLDGGTLYVDILEVNPPLFIWLDLPLVWLARVTGLDAILAYRLAATAVLAWAAVMAWRLLPRAGVTGAERTWFTAAVVLSLFLLPRLDWGEREHLAFALTLPWVLLAAAPGGTSLAGRVLLGAAAGVGIALKPHFVLVWLAREAARRLGGSAAGRLGSADSWVPVLVCVAYLGAAVIFTPEYFSLARELAGPYNRFIRASVLETLVGPAPALALVALVTFLGLSAARLGADGSPPLPRLAARSSPLAALLPPLLWCTVAWSAVALLQLKGFRYHWLPAMGTGFLLLAVLVRLAWPMQLEGLSRFHRAVGFAVLGTAVATLGLSAARQAVTPRAPEWDADPSIGLLLPVLERLGARGDTLAVLSINMASGFPLTNYAGTVWPLRLTHMWPVVSEYRAELERHDGELVPVRSRAATTPMERWAVGVVAEDLVRTRPEWMLAFRSLRGRDAPYMSRLSLRDFTSRDPRIPAVWAAYDSLGTVGMYTLWHRRDAGPVPAVGDVQWPAARNAAGTSGRPVVAPGAAFAAVLFAGLLLFGMRPRRLAA